MLYRLIVCLLIVLCMIAPRTLAATDINAMVKDCEGCHGKNGVSECLDMPTIAGISSGSHEDALFDYQDGARPCEESDYRHGGGGKAATDMCAVTKDMSEDDIIAIAAWFAKQEFVAMKQDFDADKAKAGEAVHDRDCKRCHSDGGANPEDDAGILAGQPMGYLKTTFKEYRSGERKQPKKMQPKVEALSDEEVEALIHFYASQQ